MPAQVDEVAGVRAVGGALLTALKAAIEVNGLAWVPLPPGAAVLSMNHTDVLDLERHRAGAGEVVGVAGDGVEAGVAQRVGEGVDAGEAGAGV